MCVCVSVAVLQRQRGMEGEEQEAASTELSSDNGSDQEETQNKMEPFLFSFISKNDDIFCVENFDRRKLKVFASFE